MSHVNYNKVAETKAKPNQVQNGVNTIKAVVREPVNVVPEEPVVETLAPEVIGAVTNCSRLNVRAKPDITASVVCVIPKASEVTINEAESTKDFYKVCTAAGAEGFCVKEFIELK